MGDDPTIACYRGLGLHWWFMSGGFNPSGPNDMGSGGNLASAPSFPFLLYGPAPA